jgi:DNA-binding NtrC family response regulator
VIPDASMIPYFFNDLISSIWFWIAGKTAKDAQQALATLQNDGLYDLIISEFHLLGMNGLDFQKHIYIQHRFHIPIISKCQFHIAIISKDFVGMDNIFFVYFLNK